jgi:hypothetical protein
VALYPCPRTDLGCTAVLSTGGDLDYHFHLAHGYRGGWRIAVSVRPPRPLPTGLPPERHVPDGLVEGSGTPTMAERRADREVSAPSPAAGRSRPAGGGGNDSRGRPGRRRPAELTGSGVLAGLRPSGTVAEADAGRHRRRRLRISR